jgi:hypothetical protein
LRHARNVFSCTFSISRSTCFFSAYHLRSVERLARSALINEINIEVGQTWSGKKPSREEGGRAGQGTDAMGQVERGLSLIPAHIKQHVLFLHTYQKKVRSPPFASVLLGHSLSLPLLLPFSPSSYSCAGQAAGGPPVNSVPTSTGILRQHTER